MVLCTTVLLYNTILKPYKPKETKMKPSKKTKKEIMLAVLDFAKKGQEKYNANENIPYIERLYNTCIKLVSGQVSEQAEKSDEAL